MFCLNCYPQRFPTIMYGSLDCVPISSKSFFTNMTRMERDLIFHYFKPILNILHPIDYDKESSR